MYKRAKTIGILLLLVLAVGLFFGCAEEEAASVGIIGGADGPTKIYVSGQGEEEEVTPPSASPAAITPAPTTPAVAAPTTGAAASPTAATSPSIAVPPAPAQASEPKPSSCTITITCKTILDNISALDPAKEEVLPGDGVILAAKEVSFTPGESVYDLLARTVKENKIHMESVETLAFKCQYIEGIGNLYEFDCGELSGWMYKVNDVYPNYGCSKYELEDGDRVEWIYTCDLGRDIGASGINQNQ